MQHPSLLSMFFEKNQIRAEITPLDNDIEQYRIAQNQEVKHYSDKEDKEEEEDKGECPICLNQEVDTIVRLQCQHTFHHICLHAWETRNNSCPMCRRPIVRIHDVSTSDNTTLGNDPKDCDIKTLHKHVRGRIRTLWAAKNMNIRDKTPEEKKEIRMTIRELEPSLFEEMKQLNVKTVHMNKRASMTFETRIMRPSITTQMVEHAVMQCSQGNTRLAEAVLSRIEQFRNESARERNVVRCSRNRRRVRFRTP